MNQIVKLAIVALILGSIVLLWLQNQQPISLTMFGFYRTPELGLGVWVILFTLAGIITSIFLQFLGAVSQTPQAKLKPKPPVKESGEKPLVEWDKQSEKSEPWDNLNPSPPSSPPPPPSEAPPSTTYSYSYIKATPQEKKNSTDQIYDAPYRIITPPYNENTPPPPEKDGDEEDEEWI